MTQAVERAETGVAVVERQMGAGVERVFEVLSDGWAYASWVVGASHIRAVAPDWPAVGSRIHHASGAWPLLLRDETRVVACDPPHGLTLIARGRPWGDARIQLELEERGDGCLVRMHEEAVKGLGRLLHTPATDVVLRGRNHEALGRLQAIVERRSTPD